MSSQQKTVGFLVEQMSDAGEIRSRKMFGEYAIYCNQKVVALVCDDQLFIKPTTSGKAFITRLRMPRVEADMRAEGIKSVSKNSLASRPEFFITEPIEKPPYPGAKAYFWISGNFWDDAEWLSELIRITATELPLPKAHK